MRLKLFGVLALALGAALAGCGGGDERAVLTPDERVTVASFNADVSLTVLDGSAYGSLLDSIDATIGLAREKPDADYDGRTMEQVLSDAASDLQPYQPDLASKLDRAVATLGEGSGGSGDAEPPPSDEPLEDLPPLATDADSDLLQAVNDGAKDMLQQIDAVNACESDTSCIESELARLGQRAESQITALDQRAQPASAECARDAGAAFRSALEEYVAAADLAAQRSYDDASMRLEEAAEQQDAVARELRPCADDLGIPVTP